MGPFARFGLYLSGNTPDNKGVQRNKTPETNMRDARTAQTQDIQPGDRFTMVGLEGHVREAFAYDTGQVDGHTAVILAEVFEGNRAQEMRLEYQHLDDVWTLHCDAYGPDWYDAQRTITKA